jgi:hypothetical protein
MTSSAQGGKTAAAARPSGVEVAPERANFYALLLGNPNYFGNLVDYPQKAVKKIKEDTSYEQIICLGLNPGLDRLEAVIDIKRDSGYGGAICTSGSREYVRFYADLHGNDTWQDLGLADVVVHDIPGQKPLCYMVARTFTPALATCTHPHLLRVLAILSWTVPPPANHPFFIPVYGNRISATVQVRPIWWFLWGDVVKANLLTKDFGSIADLVDPTTKVPLAPPAVTTLAMRRQIYGTKVPVHRFAFPEVQQLLAQTVAPASDAADPGPLEALGLNATEVIDIVGQAVLEPTGNTTFEELRCAGLLPAGDTLAATLTVKEDLGYSGNLCTAGSYEYVGFWIDFGDGDGLTYVGTSSVQVHDLANIPAEGLQYGVFLGTDFSQRIKPCQTGPQVVHLRAILSWAVAPPPANPNYVPVWGNRVDCLVQLRPGGIAGHVPEIETVGSVGIDDIDSTGLANPPGATLQNAQRPFGGAIRITGRIGDPPDNFGGPAAKFRYKIEVSPAGPGVSTNWQPLTNSIVVEISEAQDGVGLNCSPGELVCDVPLTPTDDFDGLGPGWYDYLQDYKGSLTRALVNNELGEWLTSPQMEGTWKIRVTAKDMATSPPTVYGATQPDVVVQIDNTAAIADLAITGATYEGNELPPAVNCQFPVGAILHGTYSVADPGTVPNSPTNPQHFGAFSLEVLPSGNTPSPSSSAFPAVPTTGEAGTWTLDTTGMPPCGYILLLTSCDRTIYDSDVNESLCTNKSVGICLVDPATFQ